MWTQSVLTRIYSGLSSAALFVALLNGSGAMAQQSSVLLEVCNSIDEKDKRLMCLKELDTFKGVPGKQVTSVATLKNAFAALGGALDAGTSYDNYRSMILEPAKAVGVFKHENPNTSTEVLNLLDKAVRAYSDAERLWNASIYKSQDGGIFGKILNYENLGLTDIVHRYRLPTTTVLFNAHVPISSALPAIWSQARDAYREAFSILDKPAIDPTGKMNPNSAVGRVLCKLGDSQLLSTTPQMCADIAGVPQ